MMMLDSDEALVAALQGNRRTAADKLFRMYQNRLFSFLVRLGGNTAVAEDATQETFIRALNRIQSFDPEQGSFKAWLFTIGRNEFYRIVKKEQRSGDIAENYYQQFKNDNQVLMQNISPQCEKLLDKEKRKRLEAAIENLSPAEREVVLLRIAEDLTFSEIAAVIGVPLGTALGRMRNAQNQLKRLIRDEGEEHEM